MDPFTHISTIDSQGTRAGPVTPSDTDDLQDVPKALYVGVGGDIAMIGSKAHPQAAGIVWKNVPTGAVLPFRPRRILATGTTAASILALY